MDESSAKPLVEFDALHVSQEQLCTLPMYRFLRDFDEGVRYFYFVVMLATKADEIRLAASKALAMSGDEVSKARHEKALADPKPAFDAIRSFSNLQSKNLVLNSCNAFLVFYSEILQSAIIKRPETLKSKQTIRLDELLGFSKFDELVRYIVDKKINELSYAGLAQMEEFMSERLGVCDIINDRQRLLTSIFVEIRNITTHNRGVVNSIFLSRISDTAGFNFVEGKYFHVDFDHFAVLGSNVLKVAAEIDRAVAKKFGLKRKRYKTWLATLSQKMVESSPLPEEFRRPPSA